MEQTSKEILMKDLCARLPYSVKVQVVNEDVLLYSNEEGFIVGKESINDNCFIIQCNNDSYVLSYDDFKPYLFPLSSMTKEQQEEFDRIYIDDMRVIVDNITNRLEGKSYETNFGPYKYIDWLNENHFDYRGLIPMELAIDATGLNIY